MRRKRAVVHTVPNEKRLSISDAQRGKVTVAAKGMVKSRVAAVKILRRSRRREQRSFKADACDKVVVNYLPGRSTTLITPSSLSRNFLYIAGASSRLAGWVTTKLGSMSPASILFKSGLV
jgi:hypothetical protein